jgi:WD40 repeat protein
MFPSPPQPGLVNVCDAATGKHLRSLGSWDNSRFESLVFLAGGKLLCGLTPWTIYFWEVSTGEVRRILEGPRDENRAAAMTTDGAVAAWYCAGGIRLWDVAAGREEFVLPAPKGSLLAFSADGRSLASAPGTFDSGNVIVWDIPTWKVRTIFEARDGPVRGLALSPDGGVLATQHAFGVVNLWDVTGKCFRAGIIAYSERVDRCVFSQDGQTLASVGSDEDSRFCVRLWNVATRRFLTELANDALCRSDAMVFSRDSKRLVVGWNDGTVQLYPIP